MHKFEKEINWEGVAEVLAVKAKTWLNIKRIGDPKFIPNERLIRDYVSRGILTKPERRGKEAIFGFRQLTEFLACRTMVEDGWPLSKISEDFSVSSLEDILKLIPGEETDNDAVTVVESLKKFSFSASHPPQYSMPGESQIRSEREPNKDDYIYEKKKDFSRRRRESYENRTDLKELLQRLGSDFGSVIKEEFTALQLATWLLLFIDKKKAEQITRQEAEDIGRTVTAALLNKEVISGVTREDYGRRLRDLNQLERKIKNKEYDLQRYESEIQKKIDILSKMQKPED